MHLAAFFAHLDFVELLLKNGASVEAKNTRNKAPLDVVSADWSTELEGVYTSIANSIGMHVDLPRIREARSKVATLLREHTAKSVRRGSYAHRSVRMSPPHLAAAAERLPSPAGSQSTIQRNRIHCRRRVRS